MATDMAFFLVPGDNAAAATRAGRRLCSSAQIDRALANADLGALRELAARWTERLRNVGGDDLSDDALTILRGLPDLPPLPSTTTAPCTAGTTDTRRGGLLPIQRTFVAPHQGCSRFDDTCSAS
ncbi:hypothetical protein [Embleya sp. NPDC005971]|uniref:hypothetical protein n=1 Tax=Embleya sp. NPDC005971 TaxID=3156724 RepID=UPI0033DF4C31